MMILDLNSKDHAEHAVLVVVIRGAVGSRLQLGQSEAIVYTQHQ